MEAVWGRAGVDEVLTTRTPGFTGLWGKFRYTIIVRWVWQ